MKTGVQLYTVRVEMEQGLSEAFDGIAAAGLDGVELWFPANYPPASELARISKDAGLELFSAHVPFLDLRDRFTEVADYHGEIGNTNLAIPNIPAQLRASEDDWKRRTAEIAKIAENAKKAGFHFHYHNHMMEFTNSVNGKDVHDYLFENISADLLKAELDTCFIKRVEKDPASYITRYADRCTLLHIKDSNPKDDPVDTIVGDGTVDWESVFKAVGGTKIEWLIMEQGHHETGAFDSLRRSMEFLKARGFIG
jgi:sugar phosphate isomerase/epimerase